MLFYYLSKKSANYKQLVRRQHTAPHRTRKPKTFRPPAVSFVFASRYVVMYAGNCLLENLEMSVNLTADR